MLFLFNVVECFGLPLSVRSSERECEIGINGVVHPLHIFRFA